MLLPLLCPSRVMFATGWHNAYISLLYIVLTWVVLNLPRRYTPYDVCKAKKKKKKKSRQKRLFRKNKPTIDQGTLTRYTRLTVKHMYVCERFPTVRRPYGTTGDFGFPGLTSARVLRLRDNGPGVCEVVRWTETRSVRRTTFVSRCVCDTTTTGIVCDVALAETLATKFWNFTVVDRPRTGRARAINKFSIINC